MQSAPFDLDAYLNRVNLSEAPDRTIDGLHALHQAQFFTIPFENLDIQLGRAIDLAPSALFEKLVRNKRGGYCFELNGLMLLALQALGFSARPLLARVNLEGTPSARTHQISYIELANEHWIVDVGFGATGPRAPMLLEHNRVIQNDGFSHRLVEDPVWGWMLQTLEDATWKNNYSFDLGLATPQDIQLGNFYTSNSPDTLFTQVRVVGKPLRDGSVSLSNNTLTTLKQGQTTEFELPSGPGYFAALERIFDIRLDAAFSEFRQTFEKTVI